jgi:error-prone DNA polymerase
VVLGAQLMVVRGKLQREGIVIHVVADDMIDRSDLLARLNETDASAGPFRAPIAHADHAKSSGPPDPRDPYPQRREQTLLDGFRSRDFH